jgi:hypothetical protein
VPHVLAVAHCCHADVSVSNTPQRSHGQGAVDMTRPISFLLLLALLAGVAIQGSGAVRQCWSLVRCNQPVHDMHRLIAPCFQLSGQPGSMLLLRCFHSGRDYTAMAFFWVPWLRLPAGVLLYMLVLQQQLCFCTQHQVAPWIFSCAHAGVQCCLAACVHLLNAMRWSSSCTLNSLMAVVAIAGCGLALPGAALVDLLLCIFRCLASLKPRCANCNDTTTRSPSCSDSCSGNNSDGKLGSASFTTSAKQQGDDAHSCNCCKHEDDSYCSVVKSLLLGTCRLWMHMRIVLHMTLCIWQLHVMLMCISCIRRARAFLVWATAGCTRAATTVAAYTVLHFLSFAWSFRPRREQQQIFQVVCAWHRSAFACMMRLVGVDMEQHYLAPRRSQHTQQAAQQGQLITY